MNSKFRVILISSLVIISTLLVWPNIGMRTIEVYFETGLSAEDTAKAMEGLDAFLKKNYTGRYEWEKKEKTIKPEGEAITPEGKLNLSAEKKVSYYEIRGNFVQTAFLNELSRIKGVESEKISLKPMWMEKSLKAKPFKLGLDLQGGMNLVLEGDFELLSAQLKKRYSESYMKELDAKIAAEKDKNKQDGLKFEKQRILDSMNFTEQKRREYMEGAKEIIRSRIDKTGVAENLIRLQGFDKIEISLPGVASPERAKKMISSTAKVEYHLAQKPGEPWTERANQKFPDFRKLETETERKIFIEKLEKDMQLPPTLGIYAVWDKAREDAKKKLMPVSFMVLENEVALSGDDISPETFASFDQERFQHTVNFTMTSEGTKKFGKITSENKGRQLAILIDERIRSAPNINEPILTGQAVISGSFTQEEAKDLALIIKEGALPVPLKIAEERSIGPSLGQESINNGVEAILIGFAGVVIFMLVVYHMAGIIANIALFLNLLFMMALLGWNDSTITLPGLTGIVLTLGMAVDANVIIYERIKEELGRGKSFKMAVSQGFERATMTILDSNLTTIIAAVVLTKFGVGPIKGFAVTLLIGIITSLFTSLFVSKTIFYFITYDMNGRIPMGFGKYRKQMRQGLTTATAD